MPLLSAPRLSLPFADRLPASGRTDVFRDDSARGILTAFWRALRLRLSEEEQRRLDRIHDLSQRSRQDADPIIVHDFGAGPWRHPITPDERKAGRIRIEPVSAVAGCSSPARWRTFLFLLTRYLKPKRVLEMGTCLGMSTAAFAEAQRMNANDGKVIGIEGSPALAERTRSTLDALSINGQAQVVTGRFQDQLPEVLDDIGPVDLAYVDGHHDGPATVAYFRRLVHACRPGSVIVFDDIHWSSSMRRGWATIIRDPALRVSLSFGKVGVVIVDRDLSTPSTHLTPPQVLGQMVRAAVLQP